MKKWLHDFFSTSNDINENIVIGVIFAAAFLIALFTNVDDSKFYTLAGTLCLFFGVGALKK